MAAGGAVVVLAAATAVTLTLSHNGTPRRTTSTVPAGPAALPAAAMLVRVDTGGAVGSPGRETRVYSFRPGGGARHELAGTRAGDVLPRWSHDRRQIALTHTTGTGNEIYLMNADGGDRRRLLTGVTGGRVAWSADDTRLAYLKKVDGVGQIFVSPVGGGAATQLTHAADDKDDPVWSPDGASILYWAKQDGVKSIYALTVADPQEPGRPITARALGDAVDPAISPDGAHVLFTKPIDDGNSDIWLVDADGSGPHAVADDPAREMDPSWSPDGTWFAFVRGDYNHPQIVAERPDRSGERTLTVAGAREGHPCWY